MSPRKRNILIVVTVAFFFLVGFFPSVANAVCYQAGTLGHCPLRTVLLVIIFSLLSVIALFTCGLLWLKRNRNTIFVWSLIGLTILGGTLLRIKHSITSKILLTEYCRGLSETVRLKIDSQNLRSFFEAALQSTDKTGEGLYPLDAQSSLYNIFPDFYPVAATSSGATRQVTVLWKCRGASFGLRYSEVEPQKHTWLDTNLMLDDKIWVITRSQ